MNCLLLLLLLLLQNKLQGDPYHNRTATATATATTTTTATRPWYHHVCMVRIPTYCTQHHNNKQYFDRADPVCSKEKGRLLATSADEDFLDGASWRLLVWCGVVVAAFRVLRPVGLSIYPPPPPPPHHGSPLSLPTIRQVVR